MAVCIYGLVMLHAVSTQLLPFLVLLNLLFQTSIPDEIHCLNSTIVDTNCTNFTIYSLNNENKDCKPYFLIDVSWIELSHVLSPTNMFYSVFSVSFTARPDLDDCVRRLSSPYFAIQDNHPVGWNGRIYCCLYSIHQRSARHTEIFMCTQGVSGYFYFHFRKWWMRRVGSTVFYKKS